MQRQDSTADLQEQQRWHDALRVVPVNSGPSRRMIKPGAKEATLI